MMMFKKSEEGVIPQKTDTPFSRRLEISFIVSMCVLSQIHMGIIPPPPK